MQKKRLQQRKAAKNKTLPSPLSLKNMHFGQSKRNVSFKKVDYLHRKLVITFF